MKTEGGTPFSIEANENYGYIAVCHDAFLLCAEVNLYTNSSLKGMLKARKSNHGKDIEPQFP